MHLEASDPTFIDAFLPHNAGRNDRLDRIDRGKRRSKTGCRSAASRISR